MMAAPPVDPNAMPVDPSAMAAPAPAPAPDPSSALMALLATQGLQQPKQQSAPDPAVTMAALTPALTALLGIIDKSYQWGMDRGAEVSAKAQAAQTTTPRAPAAGAMPPQPPSKYQGA